MCENNPLSTEDDEDEMEMDVTDGEDHLSTTDTLEKKETKEWKRLLEEHHVYTRESPEDIEKVAKRIKRCTSGGPQQMTPWMLRQAIEGSANGSCSLTIAKLSNRIDTGDFDRVSGRAFSMMRYVAL